MAKKKEPIVINKDPLSVTVLGSMAERKGNLAFLIVIFVLMILAIVVYPYVYPYIDEFLNGPAQTQPPVVSLDSEATEDLEETKEEHISKGVICKKSRETLTYFNKKDGIYKINHLITLNIEDSDYFEKYFSYMEKTNNLEKLDGYSATMNTEASLTKIQISIDLQKADISLAQNQNYFEKGTSVEDIKTNMENNGFSCIVG